MQKIEVWFEISNSCNLSCRYCYFLSDPTPVTPQTTLATAKMLAHHIPISHVTLTGGEPLICPGIEKIVKVFSSKAIPVIIATNGVLLTEERIRRLIECGVCTFQVPILAGNPEIHNFLTRNKSWEKSLYSIIRLRKYNCNIAIVFVATKFNINEFIGVLEISKICDISQVVFNKFTSCQGAARENKANLSIADDSLLMKEIFDGDKFAEQHGIKILLGTPLGLSTNNHALKKLRVTSGGACTIVNKALSIVVDRTGNIRLCPQSSKIHGRIEQFVAGNVTGNSLINALGNWQEGLLLERGDNRNTNVCILDQ